MNNTQQHWETVFETKNTTEVSWYQKIPQTSIQFFESLNLPKTCPIIDVGAGDSYFVDYLLEKKYQNVYVLDISEKALQKTKERLGKKANKVNWVVSDILAFTTTTKFGFWHDRASFHFQTNEPEINKYISIADKNIAPNGSMIIATFSESGPQKCSGLEVKQYSENTLSQLFEKYFEKIKCVNENHSTPFGTVQNFVFCSFKK